MNWEYFTLLLWTIPLSSKVQPSIAAPTTEVELETSIFVLHLILVSFDFFDWNDLTPPPFSFIFGLFSRNLCNKLMSEIIRFALRFEPLTIDFTSGMPWHFNRDYESPPISTIAFVHKCDIENQVWDFLKTQNHLCLGRITFSNKNHAQVGGIRKAKLTWHFYSA